MHGQAVHSTRPHARLPPSFLVRMITGPWPRNWAYFIRQINGSLMCLAHFSWFVTHGFLYNQALENVRSTGAGIKCLYCTCTRSWAYMPAIHCNYRCRTNDLPWIMLTQSLATRVGSWTFDVAAKAICPKRYFFMLTSIVSVSVCLSTDI